MCHCGKAQPRDFLGLIQALGKGVRRCKAGKTATSRREFLKNTGRMGASSVLVAGIVSRRYAAQNSTIQLALVGCGGRGTGAVADAFSTTGGPVPLYAVADLFAPRVQTQPLELTALPLLQRTKR